MSAKKISLRMRLTNICLLFASLITVSNVSAATFPSYYCPTTYQSVRIGDDSTTLRAACGNPNTVTTRQEQIQTPTQTLVWIYTLGLFSVKGASFFLPTLTITFDNNQKVIQVDRSGTVIVTGFCAINGVVNLGDSATQVLATCGQPSYASTRQQVTNSSKDITEWTYNYGPYKPQIIFDLEDDKITQITSGQLGK